VVRYDVLAVGDAGDAGSPPDEPAWLGEEPLPVLVPGTSILPGSRWQITAEVLPVEDAAGFADNDDSWTACLDGDALAQPLVLRGRRRGDRFCPQGMAGHGVKLSAFMINLKIPRAWRDRVPLLVAGDEIVWVCGRRTGESVAVRPESQRVVRLFFERAR